MPGQRIIHVLAVAAVMLLGLPALPAGAQTPPYASPAFEAVWTRTDQPVAAQAVQRTWLWGPNPVTAGQQEAYAQSPGGQRLVQYFDKSRMEITNPGGDPASRWFVTNGLLSRELISGQLQTGDATFEERTPAWIPVAGDPDDTDGPLYSTFREQLNAPPRGVGEVITETLNRAGTRGNQAELARYGVTAAYLVPETNHVIASPFWAFLQTAGPVQTATGLETQPLFEPTFFATGLPITEAYWARVKVAGALKDVLVQAFERRVLTFTPSNPAGFQVEMGNVGRHYYGWRYEDQGRPPAPPPAPAPVPEAESPYDGIWSVGSSFVDKFKLLVDHGAVLQLSGIFIRGVCRIHVEAQFTPDQGRLSDGTFFVRAKGSQYELALTGTFSSPKRVTGTGEMRIGVPGCREVVGFGWEGSKTAEIDRTVFDLDGAWQGSTKNGEVITFTVKGGSIVDFQVQWHRRDECLMLLSGPIPIVNKTATIAAQHETGTVSMFGTFRTSSYIEGDGRFSAAHEECSVGSSHRYFTWRAAKQ